MATIALSTIRVALLSSGGASAAEISAALVSSAIGAVSVVIVVAGSAALTLCAAIATPLSRLADSFERGGEPGMAPRLRDAARLDEAMRKLVAEARSREREGAAERERHWRGELAAVEQSTAQAEARLGELAPIAEALGRLARGDLTVRLASEREANPSRAKLDQAVSLIAKTVLAFSTSLDAISDGAGKMNHSVETYGEEIAKATARMEAALGALAREAEATAKLAAPLSDAAALLRALVEDAAPQGARRSAAAFGEIRRAASEIAPILALVDELAFQTNMLALNAGVEAARVGDAGRGMGVVAQELRLLAGRAAQAAQDSSALLARVQAEAERGGGELSTVESALVALPERARAILAILDRTSVALAEEKGPRDIRRSLSEALAEAAAARIRLKDAMAGESEALESLIDKLSALTDRFKLEPDDSAAFRPPLAKASVSANPRALPSPALRRAQRTGGHQNNS